MDLEKIFKNLIIAQAIFIFLTFFSAIYTPIELLEISEYVPAGIYETQLGLILSILLLVAYLISLILLYRYISYGKKIYVAVIIIGFILDLAGGAFLMTSISFVLGSMVTLIGGATLAILFFSPIKNKFD